MQKVEISMSNYIVVLFLFLIIPSTILLNLGKSNHLLQLKANN
jgi:hypothetical protein